VRKKGTAVYGKIMLFIIVALLTLLILSCPNPIDTTLALKVEDETPPVITIITPDQNTTNYYDSTIDISGVIKDFTDSGEKAGGSVNEVFYEEQYNKRINGNIDIASDGSFSFSFSTISPDQLSGTQYIVIIAIDWNDNIAEKVVTLYDKTTGPRITVFDHGPGDFNKYTSNTNVSVPATVATMTITGIVGLPTFYLKYDVEPEVGSPISGRDIAYDSGNGDFSFDFTPRDEGVSGELRFVLKAFDGKDSSTVFILTDDPFPPDLDDVTVAGDNTYLDLSFPGGIYHTGGTEPQAVDFSLSPVSGGTATDVSFSPVVFAITPSAGDDFIRLNIDVTGTPDGNESFDITAADLTDEVGNPISIGQDSFNLSLHDKAQPWVTRVYSTETAGSAFNSGDIPILVEFNEPVDD